MKKFNLVLIILIFVIAFLLAFCKENADSVSDPLNGTSWVLYAYRKSKPLPETTITAIFEDGQIRGSAGCNSFSGDYSVRGGKITVGPMAITMMACLDPEGVMEQEQLVLEYLGDAQTYQLSDERLMIYQSDGEALTFVPTE